MPLCAEQSLHPLLAFWDNVSHWIWLVYHWQAIKLLGSADVYPPSRHHWGYKLMLLSQAFYKCARIQTQMVMLTHQALYPLSNAVFSVLRNHNVQDSFPYVLTALVAFVFLTTAILTGMWWNLNEVCICTLDRGFLYGYHKCPKIILVIWHWLFENHWIIFCRTIILTYERLYIQEHWIIAHCNIIIMTIRAMVNIMERKWLPVKDCFH